MKLRFLRFLATGRASATSLRHIPADFFLDDFAQRDVRRAEVAGTSR